MKKKQSRVSKVKKKKWFPIFSPVSMGQKLVGESYLENAESALGSTVSINMMAITGDIKNQNITLKFEIKSANGDNLSTNIIGYKFSNSSIKRFVRRKMTRIDDSLIIKTKDDVKVRIKPFVLTRGKVTKSVEYNLRVTLREEMIDFCSKKNYEELFSEIIKYQLQRKIKLKLNKIFPVRGVEIRMFERKKSDETVSENFVSEVKKRKAV